MSFASFELHPGLLRAVRELGFVRATPIQAQAIPPILQGRDVLACAPTGTGKTAAFLLPILHGLIDRPRRVTRVLVVTPTRELAAQIDEQRRRLARHVGIAGAAIVGGVGMGPQEQSIRAGVDVLVATPGRLLDHCARAYGGLPAVEVLVIDEADRMLDMGFLPDVRRILAQLPARRQTLLCSATVPPEIVALAGAILREPVSVGIGRPTAVARGISHRAYSVASERKAGLLLELLKQPDVCSVLAFTRTKHRANRLSEFLRRQHVATDRIHGSRTQAQRSAALSRFKSGAVKVLVATDIAARGIDICGLTHVVNYDVPLGPDDYAHRVGRTARAEAVGDAITLVSADEEPRLQAIERRLGCRIARVDLPDFNARDTPGAGASSARPTTNWHRKGGPPWPSARSN